MLRIHDYKSFGTYSHIIRTFCGILACLADSAQESSCHPGQLDVLQCSPRAIASPGTNRWVPKLVLRQGHLNEWCGSVAVIGALGGTKPSAVEPRMY